MFYTLYIVLLVVFLMMSVIHYIVSDKNSEEVLFLNILLSIIWPAGMLIFILANLFIIALFILMYPLRMARYKYKPKGTMEKPTLSDFRLWYL